MCGRYSLTSPLDELVEVFGVSVVALEEYRPRFNIAPTQEAPVIVRGPAGLRLGSLRWGLIPHWAEDRRFGSRMINARSETVAALPAFREAFRSRRCLVPADGFYEWKPGESGGAARGRRGAGKVPYWIHSADRRPFAFAGVWERWRSREGERVSSFTILTTVANEQIRPLHDRMPVVIPAAAWQTWLDPDADRARLTELLGPSPEAFFEAWPVSTLVNSAGVDEPLCILPLSEQQDRFL
jgi:putative SOS response-associated peptidase YedK